MCVLYNRDKRDMSGHAAFKNTALFTIWNNEDDTWIRGKKATFLDSSQICLATVNYMKIIDRRTLGRLIQVNVAGNSIKKSRVIMICKFHKRYLTHWLYLDCHPHCRGKVCFCRLRGQYLHLKSKSNQNVIPHPVQRMTERHSESM